MVALKLSSFVVFIFDVHRVVKWNTSSSTSAHKGVTPCSLSLSADQWWFNQYRPIVIIVSGIYYMVIWNSLGTAPCHFWLTYFTLEKESWHNQIKCSTCQICKYASLLWTNLDTPVCVGDIISTVLFLGFSLNVSWYNI